MNHKMLAQMVCRVTWGENGGNFFASLLKPEIRRVTAALSERHVPYAVTFQPAYLLAAFAGGRVKSDASCQACFRMKKQA
jgi:hypothetical protein